jgi:eukaryotic-like serine/threonine-protein kinase
VSLRDALAVALSAHYRLERELGRGGFATVFLAQDLRHDRPVALKVLHPEIAATLGSERFKQEIRLAARLQHPHILGVFDSGEAGGHLWFTMPFVEGESLRQRLGRERQIGVDEAVRIAGEAADALDYAHRHGVVHRDIKPENILLADGHALVGDFGIARGSGAGGLTQTGVTVGTPAYMSPEQAGGGEVDARTDIYALGCVLYEMLVGEPPFSGPTTAAVLLRALTETPRPVRATRPATPVALEAAVSRAMARVPADRFASAAELAAALRPAKEESTSGAATVAMTRPAVVARPAWRRPSVATTVALFVVLLAAGAGWYRSSSVTAGTKRLAVLPFENLGAQADDYFADGITDEVRGKLSALEGLQVTARQSAIQYKKAAGKTPEQIGRELGVDFLLTGTVRWQAPQGATRRVRVSPELIRVADGTARWQQAFDTELNDVFQVQADIASRVAQALDVELGATSKEQLSERPTSNVAAYDAFLRGEQESQGGTISDPLPLRKAIAAYEQAVALDPGFVQAWAHLSRSACALISTTPSPEDIARCRSGAERAVAMAPNRPDSRLAMGAYFRTVEKAYDKALEQYTIALQRVPNNADLLAASAVIERTLGRFDDALLHLQRAAQLDPRSVPAASNLARTYHDLHRHAEAQTEYSRAQVLAPTSLALVQNKAADLLSQGDLAGARAVIAAALPHSSVTATLVRFATFQEMMWVLPDDLRDQVVNLQPADFASDRNMWALKVGATYRLMGDAAKAKSYGEIAAGGFAKIAERYPDDPQQTELYGRALALAGRNDEAVKAGERSLAMRGTSLDAVNGPYYKYQVARIYIQAGQYDRALDLIEPLLSKPGDITPGWLRVDPIFTPLRGTPRFQRLVNSGT